MCTECFFPASALSTVADRTGYEEEPAEVVAVAALQRLPCSFGQAVFSESPHRPEDPALLFFPAAGGPPAGVVE